MNEEWNEMLNDVSKMLNVNSDQVGYVTSDSEGAESEYLYWYYDTKMKKSKVVSHNYHYELREHDGHRFVSHFADGGLMCYFFISDIIQ